MLGKGIGKVYRYNKDDVIEIQNFQGKNAQGREVAKYNSTFLKQVTHKKNINKCQ